MDTPASLPLALYKAQAALVLQMIESLKTGRQRWFELGAGLLANDVAETQSALAELQDTEDWRALVELLPGAYWRINQRWISMLQGVAQTAIANQSHFATESQRAMLAWQQASVQALSTARNAMPMHTLIENALAVFGAPADALPRTVAVAPSPARPRKTGNGEMVKAAS